MIFTITIEGIADSTAEDEDGRNVALADFIEAIERLAPYVFDNVVVTSHQTDDD